MEAASCSATQPSSSGYPQHPGILLSLALRSSLTLACSHAEGRPVKDDDGSAGPVHEFVFMEINEARADLLVSDYLPKAMPIIEEYGGQPLHSFLVSESRSSFTPPEVVALWRWPSAAHYRRITQDSRMAPLMPIRAQALDSISEGDFYSSTQGRASFPLTGQVHLLLGLLHPEPDDAASQALRSYAPLEYTLTESVFAGSRAYPKLFLVPEVPAEKLAALKGLCEERGWDYFVLTPMR